MEFEDFPEPAAEDPKARVVRTECGKSGENGFEPLHGKGPGARALFYFLLRYPGVVQPEEMPPQRAQMVLDWHESEAVTEWERHRNAAIFERQGNRNPFIDHPELAHRLMSPRT
jgi:endonuclease I